MKNNKIQDSLVNEFSYHDAVIIEAKSIDNDFILIFTDGWNEGQINEIKFIDCTINSKNDLNGREIYQILDFVSFAKDNYFMELLVWYEDNLVEVVKIQSKNMISKKMQNGNLEYEENLTEFLYS